MNDNTEQPRQQEPPHRGWHRHGERSEWGLPIDADGGPRRRNSRGGPGPRPGGPGGPGGRFGRGGPRFGDGGFSGRGPRVARGDVRNAVLVLLAEEPMHGYGIISALMERSEGAWRPSPGSVYPTLQQLSDEGLVRSEESDGKRIFELTDDGRAHVAEHLADSPPPWEAVVRDDAHAELRQAIGQVISAMKQVAQVGTPDQIAAAAELLGSTRRKLYALLAEGAEDPAAV